RAGGTTYFQPLTKALTQLKVKLIVSGQDGDGTATAAPAPSASEAADAAGGTSPGTGTGIPDASTLLSRLTDPRNVGPGMLIMGGSLVALVATRWIRAEQDRKADRRHYPATWGGPAPERRKGTRAGRVPGG